MMDTADFSSWAFRMKAYLMSNGLWGALDNQSDNWLSLSPSDRSVMLASAFVTISHALGSLHEYLAREYNPDQPKELWQRLHERFNKNTTHTHLILTKKWSDLHWRGDHNVETYLADIAQLRAQHKSAGFPISDGAAFIKLISSLPQMFDTEVSLMEDWTTPDLDRARQLLLKRQNTVKKRKFEEANTPIMDATVFKMVATPTTTTKFVKWREQWKWQQQEETKVHVLLLQQAWPHPP